MSESEQDLFSRVRIDCDLAALHPVRKPIVMVNVFRYVGDGAWTTSNSSPWLQKNLAAQRGKYDPGTTLAGREPYSAKRHGREVETRNVYTLECFKCGQFTTDVRQENLFPILNEARAARQQSVLLRKVAARLSGRT